MTSQSKIESNRSNALKSTGPKSIAGKAIASKNAIKHGLRACELLTPDEKPSDYEAYHNDALRDLAPVGFLETELAETIIKCFWRLRRCERIEAGLLGGGTHVMDKIIAKTPEEFVEILKYNQDLEDLTPPQIFGRLLILLAEDYRRKILDPNNIVIVRDNDLADLYQKARDSELNTENTDIVFDKEFMDLFFKLTASEQQRNPLTYDVALAFRTDLSQQEPLTKLTRYEAAARRSLHRALQDFQHLQDRRRESSASPLGVIDVDSSVSEAA
jgi:hypothetical protein